MRFFRFDATVGVPPDAYSAEGQDWGLPVPRWEEMRAGGDPWLHLRADRAAELYDAFRVDHVVGLYRTYARPVDKSAPFFVPQGAPKQREQGERILALFGDVATELLIRLDGDEGLFRAYEAIEFFAPVRAGDGVSAVQLLPFSDRSTL